MMMKMQQFFRFMLPGVRANNLVRSIALSSNRCQSESAAQPEVVDIDIDSMMYDDGDSESTLATTDLNGAPIAPIDVDAWADENVQYEGTIYADVRPKYENLPIPEKRANKYAFQGIKVVLPKTMINPETYRFRLDKEDQETLADNMRIIKFPKLPSLSRPDILDEADQAQ